MVFDAEKEFEGFSAYDATLYMFEHYASQTATMSKLSPGYKFWKKHSNRNPQLTGQMDLRSVDYITKAQLFNFYLLNGCIPHTKDHSLMETMTQHNHPNTSQWSQPIVVMGYDDYQISGIPGDLFEAETTCAKEHNLGQVATKWMTNMAFWSRNGPITEPMKSNPSSKEAYNATKTYISFIIGDGDNIGMVRFRNLEWVKQRMQYCRNESLADPCFPLSWTVSPHATYLTPDMLRWYYSNAQETGQDYFVLPPSGYLYSYPGMMQAEDQTSFISYTEQAARLLNTSGTVDWEMTWTWRSAIRDYFPRFAKQGIIKGVFAVNVPFNMPVFEFGHGEFYKILHSFSHVNLRSRSSEDATVLFRPREWRGTSGESDRLPFTRKFNLPPGEMAAEINGYPPGTVTYIYLTSDGGADLDALYDLVPYLNEHVKIVSHEVLIHMALEHATQQESTIPTAQAQSPLTQ
jgi:hypothetical protein